MSRHTTELPAPATTFVGRATELDALTNLIRTSRLVTITGAAGMGKTRLAIEVAGRLLGDTADWICFVGLASIAEADLLVHEVASRLEVPERPGEPLADTLASHIGAQSILLVVDNCEHLVTACARLVEMLLRACANLRVLATSLQPLRVPGEVVWRIAPLSLPTRRDPRRAAAGGVSGSEAVRLFELRARQVRPEFSVEPANADAVARVCRRLEGIPLAIELAAARMETMSVQDVLARLEDRFRLVAGEGRAIAPRHRTLHAALDWGHGLLDDEERRLFRRASVFRGGFELSAAEAICAGDGVATEDVGGVVFRLVERSLLQPAVDHRGPARYRLLEPVRQYGAERLAASGEQAMVVRRHALHYLAIAERAEREERGLDQPGWLERLEAELDNLRAALLWFRWEDPDARLRLATALSWFWVTHGHFAEGREALEAALSATGGDAPRRAAGLLAVARVSFWQGDYAAARRFCEASIDLFRGRRAAVDRGWALTLLGSVHAYQGEYQESRRRFEAALAATRDDLVRMEALVGIGEMLLQAGNLDEARARLDDVLRLAHGSEAPRGRAALFLGITHVLAGNNAGAAAQLAWSLEIFRRLGNRYGAAAALDALGALAVADSSPVRALRLCGAAAALRASIRSELAPRWRDIVHTLIVEPATSAAGDLAEVAWAEGERMQFEEAIRYAREGLVSAAQEPAPAAAPAPPEPAPKPPAGLTARELEIAGLVADGLTNRQIADRLVISERTVEGHVEHIRAKLGVRSRRLVAASIARQRAWPSS